MLSMSIIVYINVRLSCDRAYVIMCILNDYVHCGHIEMKIMTAEIAYVTIVAKSAAVALHSIISIVCGQ